MLRSLTLALALLMAAGPAAASSAVRVYGYVLGQNRAHGAPFLVLYQNHDFRIWIDGIEAPGFTKPDGYYVAHTGHIDTFVNNLGPNGGLIDSDHEDVWDGDFDETGDPSFKITQFRDVYFELTKLPDGSFDPEPHGDQFGNGNFSRSEALYLYGYQYFSGSDQSYDLVATRVSQGVPEPSTWVVLLGGLFGVGETFRRLRRRGPSSGKLAV